MTERNPPKNIMGLSHRPTLVTVQYVFCLLGLLIAFHELWSRRDSFVIFSITDFQQLCRSRIWNATIRPPRLRQHERGAHPPHLDGSVQHDPEADAADGARQPPLKLDVDEASRGLAQRGRLQVAAQLHVAVQQAQQQQHEEVRERRHLRGEAAEDLPGGVPQNHGAQPARFFPKVSHENLFPQIFFYN